MYATKWTSVCGFLWIEVNTKHCITLQQNEKNHVFFTIFFVLEAEKNCSHFQLPWNVSSLDKFGSSEVNNALTYTLFDFIHSRYTKRNNTSFFHRVFFSLPLFLYMCAVRTRYENTTIYRYPLKSHKKCRKALETEQKRRMKIEIKGRSSLFFLWCFFCIQKKIAQREFWREFFFVFDKCLRGKNSRCMWTTDHHSIITPN